MIVAQEFEPEYDLLGNQKKAEKEFMDDDLFLHESTEPTNIIWENRHWTAADYAKRTLQVVAIILGLLAISFLAIYTCKTFAIKKANEYPNVDANQIFKEVFESNKEKFFEYAKMERDDFVNSEIPMAGYYGAYCKYSRQFPESTK